MIADNDDSERITASVRTAFERRRAVAVFGEGSKLFHLPPIEHDVLCTSDHQGITEYQPDELVVTVRSGTPLTALIEQLRDHRQTLAADPPRFSGHGTVGGALACGFSGPGRPWYGNLRDSLLGLELVNGRGERLRFGGKVMKNVAGYDISRLMVGAFGTLGVILSASFRVVPIPEVEASAKRKVSSTDYFELLRSYSRRVTPLSATCYHEGELTVRFSGHEADVAEHVERFEPDDLVPVHFWDGIRDHRCPFFDSADPYWLINLSTRGGIEKIDHDTSLIEWNGSRLWLRGSDLAGSGFDGGTAIPFRNVRRTNVELGKYPLRLKRAFDPNNVLNPHIAVA